MDWKAIHKENIRCCKMWICKPGFIYGSCITVLHHSSFLQFKNTLSSLFTEQRVGRSGSSTRPAPSPDVNCSNIYLWRHLKSLLMEWMLLRSRTCKNKFWMVFNLFIPAVLTENILKVWDSHKTQLYCSQIGLCFIDLLVWQHVLTPSFGSSSSLQDVHTCSSLLLFVVTYI